MISSDETARRLLGVIKELNSSPKTFHIAHVMLNIFLSSISESEISKTRWFEDLMSHILIYSERHLNRVCFGL